MAGLEKSVRFDDGARTVLEVWGSAGPVMLFVHGMSSSRRGWRRLADAFSDRYRVFAYDQRGHGDAAAFPGPMSLARCVRDLEEVANTIGEPVDVLVGHSWGGAVAILGAAAISARRTVAIDPMLVQAPNDWYAEYVEELEETFTRTGVERDEYAGATYVGHPLDRAGKIHAMHAMTSEPIAALARENPAAAWPLPAALAEFNSPLLLAMADPEQSIVDRATMERVRSLVMPETEIAIFEGEGHSLHRSGFDAFVRAMRAFIE